TPADEAMLQRDAATVTAARRALADGREIAARQRDLTADAVKRSAEAASAAQSDATAAAQTQASRAAALQNAQSQLAQTQAAVAGDRDTLRAAQSMQTSHLKKQGQRQGEAAQHDAAL